MSQKRLLGNLTILTRRQHASNVPHLLRSHRYNLVAARMHVVEPVRMMRMRRKLLQTLCRRSAYGALDHVQSARSVYAICAQAAAPVLLELGLAPHPPNR